MSVRVIACILGLLLAGCANQQVTLQNPFYVGSETQPESEAEPAVPAKEAVNTVSTGIEYRPDSRDQQKMQELVPEAVTQPTLPLYRSQANSYQPAFTHKSLSDYAAQLSMQLADSGKWLTADSRVGVASFVQLNEDLQSTSVLGNQLSEYLIAQIQGYGLSVVDFKLLDELLVGSAGDLVFSRDHYQLASKMQMDYVLSGTMIESDKGVTVNARIVTTDSKVVVATGKVLIPHFVIGELTAHSAGNTSD